MFNWSKTAGHDVVSQHSCQKSWGGLRAHSMHGAIGYFILSYASEIRGPGDSPFHLAYGGQPVSNQRRSTYVAVSRVEGIKMRSPKFSALPLGHFVTVSRFRGFTSCYRTPATRIRTKSRFTSPIYSHVKVAHSYTGITRAEASAIIPGSSSRCCSRHTASASSVRVAIAMADRSSHQARCHSFVTATR